MIDAFCDKLTLAIKTNLNGIDDEKAEIINYGIKSIVSEVIKISAIIILANFLGVLNYAILALIFHGVYRFYAGGFHANTHFICFCTGSIFVFGNVLSSMLLGEKLHRFLPIYIIVYIYNFLMIWMYAPGDTEEKPIFSKKLRKKLKIKSFIVMSMIVILSWIITLNQVVSNILLISTLIESITLMSISYRFMNCKHGYEGYIQK